MLECPIVPIMATRELLITTFNQHEAQTRFLAGDQQIVTQVDTALNVLGGNSLAHVTADIITELPKGKEPLAQLGRTFSLAILRRIPYRKIETPSWKPIDAAFVKNLLAQKEAPDQLSLAALAEAGRTLAPYMGSNVRNLGELRHALNEVAELEDIPETVRTSIDETNKALASVFIETHIGRKTKRYYGNAFNFYEQNPNGTAAEFQEQLRAATPTDPDEVMIRRRQLAYLNNDQLSRTEFSKTVQATDKQVEHDFVWFRDNGLLDHPVSDISKRIAKNRALVLVDFKAGKEPEQIAEERSLSLAEVAGHIKAYTDAQAEKSPSQRDPVRRELIIKLIREGFNSPTIADILQISVYTVKNIAKNLRAKELIESTQLRIEKETTARRRIVRQLYRLGLTNQDISDILQVSISDIKNDTAWLIGKKLVKPKSLKGKIEQSLYERKTPLNDNKLQEDLQSQDQHATGRVDAYLSSLNTTTLANLVEEIIVVMARGDEELDRNGRDAALRILPKIPFDRIDSELWTDIRTIYLAAVGIQTKASNLETIDNLVDASTTIAPNLIVTTNEAEEVAYAWDPVRDIMDALDPESAVSLKIKDLRNLMWETILQKYDGILDYFEAMYYQGVKQKEMFKRTGKAPGYYLEILREKGRIRRLRRGKAITFSSNVSIILDLFDRGTTVKDLKRYFGYSEFTINKILYHNGRIDNNGSDGHTIPASDTIFEHSKK